MRRVTLHLRQHPAHTGGDQGHQQVSSRSEGSASNPPPVTVRLNINHANPRSMPHRTTDCAPVSRGSSRGPRRTRRRDRYAASPFTRTAPIVATPACISTSTATCAKASANPVSSAFLVAPALRVATRQQDEEQDAKYQAAYQAGLYCQADTARNLPQQCRLLGW